MAILRLKAGREKSVQRRHPWIFSGAVGKLKGTVGDGETIAIHSSDNAFLAWGAYSKNSNIRARIWSWDDQATIDKAFFRLRLSKAIQIRDRFIPWENCSARRLVHAESDGLPGLVVDQYMDTIVVQFLSAGAEYWRADIIELLVELCNPLRIYERSDVSVRSMEGLPERKGLLFGDPLNGHLEILEQGLSFLVDIEGGHKTGFYLDQRRNRHRLRSLCTGLEVLDCFCYTGGFSISALAGDAKSVTAIDTSNSALSLLHENIIKNNLHTKHVEMIEGDVFKLLRSFRDRRREFDLIVLDPPKFAPTISQVNRAARGYKDINLLALKLLRPGGMLFTFSCSGGVDQTMFQKIVAGAVLDSGVNAQILKRFFQDIDHPVSLNFPEGAYLKGLLVHVSS